MPDESKQLVTLLRELLDEDEGQGNIEKTYAEAVREAADLIESLEQERDEALQQRDRDYKRFSEAKDALTTVEAAAIEAQDKAKRQAAVLEALTTPQAAHAAMLASTHRRQEDGEVESVDFNKAIRVALQHAQEQVNG